MPEFSLALNDDQVTLQKWIHEFAVDVIRPNAEEWDEKEEFPWPIVQQAAEIGLYGWEFMAEVMMNDPTGISTVMCIEEIFWGDAGIGMALMGSGLAAAGIAASGTPEQVMEWVPQCYGSADDVQARRFLCVGARRRLRRGGYRTSASTTRPTTSGSSTAPRRGSPTAASPIFTSWSAWSIPSSARRVTPASSSRPNTTGLSMGQKYKKHGIRAQPHRRGRPRRCASPRSLPARRQGEAR